MEAPLARLVRGGYLRLTGLGPAWMPLGARVLARIREAARVLLPDALRVELPVGPAGAAWEGLLQADLQSYRQIPIFLQGMRYLPVAPQAGFSLPTQALEWAAAVDQPPGELTVDFASALTECLRKVGVVALSLPHGHRRKVWVARSEAGGVEVLECSSCGYVALRQAAAFARGVSPSEPPKGMTQVATPHADTIAGLAGLLGIEPDKTLKAMFYELDDREPVLAVLRGDLEIETEKLEETIGTPIAGPASEDAIRRSGATPGYLSPIGLHVRSPEAPNGLMVVADLSIYGMVNFVAGANRDGFHFSGVNFPRDFVATLVGDIARAQPGFACATCGSALRMIQGVEVASSKVVPDAAHFTGPDGAKALGSLVWAGLFPEMVLLAIAAAGEGAGLEWPRRIAPFDVHIVPLVETPDTNALTDLLVEGGLDVLSDDRTISAGAKLAEADWIGAPIRVIVGAKSLAQGGAEVWVAGSPPHVMSWNEAGAAILAECA